MYHAFINNHYIGSSKRIPYLKNQVEEEIKKFNLDGEAIIYNCQRSFLIRHGVDDWEITWSDVRDRPELPETVKQKRKKPANLNEMHSLHECIFELQNLVTSICEEYPVDKEKILTKLEVITSRCPKEVQQ